MPLRSILLLQEDNGTLTRANAAALPADVAGITFLGQFAGGMANNVLTGGGVSVNSQTGEVTANPSPPPPHLRSFLITTIVIRNAGGPLTGPPIRVHIHENVTEIWLTPSPLSIAGDGPGQRLTVLAHFDDDTIGDITHLTSAPAGPGLPPEPGFTWISDNNACVQPDANGRLTGVFGLSPATCTITATIRQPNWPARSASAQVRCIDEWANQPPGRNELHLLSGPGANAFAEVPNILLLPDGFLDTPEDQADFTTLVGLIVDRLNRNPSTTPFDVLEGAINYWSAFVPSRERGSSLLDDLFEFPTLFEGATEAAKNPVTRLTVAATATAGSASLDFGLPALVGELQPATHFTIDADATIYTTVNRVAANANVLRGVRFSPPLAVTATANSGATVIGRRQSVPIGVAATPGGADPWAMENLIHVVGLPVPAERIAHGATAVELQAKVTDWRTLYGARIEPARITALIYDVWARVLSDHRLADETDTAFGLAVGERPRADVRQTEQGISWHPGRTQRTHIDKYLATLSFQGTVIGTTWTLLPGGGPAKDRDLVFILARGARFSGTNRHGPEPIIALGLVDEENVRVRYGSGRSMQIVSHPLPRDRGGLPEVTNFVHATIAHEAAHSFGIDDEYGGAVPCPPAGPTSWAPSVAATFQPRARSPTAPAASAAANCAGAGRVSTARACSPGRPCRMRRRRAPSRSRSHRVVRATCAATSSTSTTSSTCASDRCSSHRRATRRGSHRRSRARRCASLPNRPTSTCSFAWNRVVRSIPPTSRRRGRMHRSCSAPMQRPLSRLPPATATPRSWRSSFGPTSRPPAGRSMHRQRRR